MNLGSGRLDTIRRRAITVPALLLAAIVIVLSLPVWLPVVALVDAVRGRFRLPLARLGLFGVQWCWIELAGVACATSLWARGRAGDHDAHYALMGWWAGALMAALRRSTGIAPRIEGGDAVRDGGAIVVARHVSLADSLLSGWALATELQLAPRYVLKRELLTDPCLDIVGSRIPNHFLDRGAAVAHDELVALEQLADGIGPGVVGVIFAEGTRANDAKRERAIEKIGETDAERAERLRPLRRLLPPRPAGSAALLRGAPDADVVLAWHTGFDGLDTFGGIIDRIAGRLPDVRFVMHRVERSEVPSGDAFVAWLDERWLEMDAAVDQALSSS